MSARQKLPSLRRGQRVSLVIAGKSEIHDQGRIREINSDKKRIMVDLDSTSNRDIGFRFLPELGQWRHFLDTSNGDWTVGLAIAPHKEVRYLIEGID